MNKEDYNNNLTSVIRIAESENSESKSETTLTKHVRNDAAIRLLRLWREGNESEQKETWEYLKKVLDEDRPSNRRLFDQT